MIYSKCPLSYKTAECFATEIIPYIGISYIRPCFYMDLASSYDQQMQITATLLGLWLPLHFLTIIQPGVEVGGASFTQT